MDYGKFSKYARTFKHRPNDAHCISQYQTGRAAGSRGPAVHQSAEDQQYISQQRTSGTSVFIGPAVKYISQQRTCGTLVGRGPTVLCSVHVHQSAEDQQYISQHRTSCTVLYFSQQRTCGNQ